MVKVRLEGLKIVRARGKYYVYARSTGEAILRGFQSNKAALLKRLAEPDMIGAYNVRRPSGPRTIPSNAWLACRLVHRSGQVRRVQGIERSHPGAISGSPQLP